MTLSAGQADGSSGQGPTVYLIHFEVPYAHARHYTGGRRAILTGGSPSTPQAAAPLLPLG